MGLLAAAIGAVYSVYATYGLARGLKSADMTFLRTSVAGILTLPVLFYYLRFQAKVLTGQWRRWPAMLKCKLTFECLASIRANMLSRKDQRHGR